MEFKSDVVSILMPVYNGERFLQQAVESVLSQDYPQWELLFVDDGSTDSTRRIIQRYPDPRIRYHYQPNSGQASALNLGLRHALGEFITTLDADDWIPPTSLSERVAYLQAHPEYGAVYANGVYIAEDGKPLSHFSEYCVSGVTGDVFDYLIVSNMFGTGAAVLIRHDEIKRLGLTYDEEIIWCQDWDFYLRLAEHIYFGYIDMESVHYRLHESGMTMQLSSERRRNSTIRARQKVLASPRFQRVSLEKRADFFYAYLLATLHGKSAEQHKVVESSEFACLPAKNRAHLMRMVANDYLLECSERQICREWLDLALANDPLDRKTIAISLLFNINASLARQAVQLYRQKLNSVRVKTPFQMISKG